MLGVSSRTQWWTLTAAFASTSLTSPTLVHNCAPITEADHSFFCCCWQKQKLLCGHQENWVTQLMKPPLLPRLKNSKSKFYLFPILAQELANQFSQRQLDLREELILVRSHRAKDNKYTKMWDSHCSD